MKQSQYLVYSDGKGNIFEDHTLYAVGRAGWDALPIPADEWIGWLPAKARCTTVFYPWDHCWQCPKASAVLPLH